MRLTLSCMSILRIEVGESYKLLVNALYCHLHGKTYKLGQRGEMVSLLRSDNRATEILCPSNGVACFP